MLQHLKIQNLALLDSAAIDFVAGFTAVTGETGAGKSVFLGALGLLSGSRADKGVIRAVLSLAFDWPMQGKPPVRLDWRHAHVFELAPDGRPRPLAMNLPLGVA